MRVLLAAAVLSGVALHAAEQAAERRGNEADVTYSRDIAPILNANCVTCHRPGAVGPFSLATYDDVAPRAELIAQVTGRRYMPPWKPEAGFGEFQDERRLSDANIDIIRRWAAAGAPKGDLRELPSAPRWPEGWQLGTPDLVVTMPEPYSLGPGGEDVYRNFVMRIPLDAPRFVRAVEIKPGTTDGLHHARLMIDHTSSARRLDAEDAAAGYDGMRSDQAEFPEGHFIGWSPGKLPAAVPDRLAWRLDPGTDLVVKAHMVPKAARQSVRLTVGFFFADAPPTETPVALHLGSMTIDIPPGASAHVVEDQYELPTDARALAIYPHAHFLGKSVDCFARLPDGTVRWLLKITDWDFNWQDEYRYAKPVHLPKGSTVVMRYVFDNSADSPRNPSRPPRRVRFGQKSTDEMAEVMLQLLPVDPAGFAVLAHGAHHKMASIALAGAEKMVADDPTSAANQEGLAISLAAVGRFDEAVAHFERALRIDPNRASAHFNLAGAHVVQGKRSEALAGYRRAVELEPDYVQAQNNLGGLLQLLGRDEEASRHYRLALRHDPMHLRARLNLANLLFAAGNFPEAEAEFRRLLAVAPRSAEGYAGLGRVLAEQGRHAEADGAFARARAFEAGRAR
jgi:Flp pilus assembly protein TadD/mono/diheme cytochrome c family protein